MKEEIREQLEETKGKIKSFKYWRVAMLDAAIVSLYFSVFDTTGQTIFGDTEVTPKGFLITVVSAILGGALRFWTRNPLKDTLEDY